MICQECKKRPATVHMTKILNGEKTEFHMCDVCAKEHQLNWGLGLEPNFPINKFLAGLLGYDANAGIGKSISLGEPQEQTCNNCGMTYQQISQLGRLGCNQCYSVFQEQLDPLLRRIHSSTRHTGKVPKRTGGAIRLRKEMESLRSQLQTHVMREEFEEAAKLRDQIRELEKTVEKDQ